MAIRNTTLPVELQDIIVDHHCSDKSMLVACSRVCKNWRLRSYLHTFSTIQLTQASVDLFDLFLNTPFSFSAIFPQVRHVRIGRPNPHLAWEISQVGPLHAILSCLSSIGKVKRLALGNVRWAFLGTEVLALVLSGFKAINLLELCHITFTSLDQFSDLICAFPHLQRIILQDIGYPETRPNNPALNPVPHGKYSLSIRGFEGHTLKRTLQWERAEIISPISRLEIAELVAQVSTSNADISMLLRTLGPFLHHLELSSNSQYMLSDIALHSLNLSRTSSLTHLSLGSATHVLSLLSWVVHLLNQIPASSAPTLKVLQIAFVSSRQFHLDEPFLRCLDNALSGPQFHELKVIHFIAFNNIVDRELETMVKKCVRDVLTSWEQKGSLRFSFVQ